MPPLVPVADEKSFLAGERVDSSHPLTLLESYKLFGNLSSRGIDFYSIRSPRRRFDRNN